MTSRHPGGYNAPYNPQEWGPVAPSPSMGPGCGFAQSSNNVTRQTQGPPTSNPGLFALPVLSLSWISLRGEVPICIPYVSNSNGFS